LASAVRRFQELHGLQPDGVVGPGTIKALNVTATRRAAQLAANLDRALRDPPLEFERFIEVNIPAFTLEVIEAGKPVLTLRTIVGRVDWPTPTLSSIVTDVMFGPSWAVPRSIAIREILPLVRKNPRYFTETRTRVFAGGIEVDPGSVDWSRMTSRTFAYRLVQEPGPLNPLGGAKLLFRSPFQVYAHDTPGRSLFARERRALSHGCIRVEHIEQLLAYLLPTWSSDSIHRLMREGRDTRVPLHDAVAIQVVYRTAWVERDGMVAFRDDIYDLDRPENQPGFMEFSPSLTGFRAIMRGTKQR
jgi:murein L,D-transpeptidase YcbB/YkuD